MKEPPPTDSSDRDIRRAPRMRGVGSGEAGGGCEHAKEGRGRGEGGCSSKLHAVIADGVICSTSL